MARRQNEGRRSHGGSMRIVDDLGVRASQGLIAFGTDLKVSLGNRGRIDVVHTRPGGVESLEPAVARTEPDRGSRRRGGRATLPAGPRTSSRSRTGQRHAVPVQLSSRRSSHDPGTRARRRRSTPPTRRRAGRRRRAAAGTPSRAWGGEHRNCSDGARVIAWTIEFLCGSGAGPEP